MVTTTREEFVIPRRAARLLGISRKTVYRWAVQALGGDKTKLPKTQRTCTGRFKIALSDVMDLRNRPVKMAEK